MLVWTEIGFASRVADPLSMWGRVIKLVVCLACELLYDILWYNTHGGLLRLCPSPSLMSSCCNIPHKFREVTSGSFLAWFPQRLGWRQWLTLHELQQCPLNHPWPSYSDASAEEGTDGKLYDRQPWLAC